MYTRQFARGSLCKGLALQWGVSEQRMGRLISRDSLQAGWVFTFHKKRLELMLKEDHSHSNDVDLCKGKVSAQGTDQLRSVCESLVSKRALGEYIESVEVQKNGFVNFSLDKRSVGVSVMNEILRDGASYGHDLGVGQGQKVVVEYSSPNIAKPFHAGHLRSMVIGNALSRLYKAFGYETTSVNYLGDWGLQYAILCVGYKHFGDESVLKNRGLRHLLEVYVKINKALEEEKRSKSENLKMEVTEMSVKLMTREPEAMKQWKLFTEMSKHDLEKMYRRFNVQFDAYEGESEISEQEMDEVLGTLKTKGCLEERNGATYLCFQEKRIPDVVVKKSNGDSVYLTRDMCTALKRSSKYGFDKMIYVTSSQQELHFKQLFEGLKKIDPELGNSCEHVTFGMVRGMKTRKGQVVLLEDIIDEVKSFAKKINVERGDRQEGDDSLAENLASANVIIQDLKYLKNAHYDFDYGKLLLPTGETGTFLQHTHARLSRILSQYGSLKKSEEGFTVSDYERLVSHRNSSNVDEAMRILSLYPAILRLSLEANEPSLVTGYLMKLSHSICSCLRTVWVLNRSDGDDEKAYSAALFYQACKLTLGSGMKLLGTLPLERV
eukprot:Nk52_evm14s1020 gene=Nk52_evmTU14s1020